MSRGSITLFVSLLLLVLLGLILAGLKSMRQAAARTTLASALEQGMYSVFAQYDRELFEDYGLLFVDGGYGTADLRLDEVLRETETYAEYILDPTKNNLTGGGNLLSIRLNREKGSVTGYVLATDQENTAFRRQVCEQMKLQAGAELLKKLSDGVSRDGDKADKLEKQAGTYRAENAQEYYEQDVAEGLCRPVRTERGQRGGSIGGRNRRRFWRECRTGLGKSASFLSAASRERVAEACVRRRGSRAFPERNQNG